ncbi:MAG: hypothetical protein ACE5DK_08870 [Paracoccaceae bacterium]
MTATRHRTPPFRALYVTALVALWIGATIANIATIFELTVSIGWLAGVSVAAGIAIVRQFRALTACGIL